MIESCAVTHVGWPQMRANEQECGNLSTWFILNYPTGALSVLNEGEVEGWIARAFYFIYLSNLSSRETFCLKSFIYVQKIEKLKMMLLQRKRRWKGTITWPFFFFSIMGPCDIQRTGGWRSSLVYPRGRSLYRNQAQENVCLQTSPWTKSIWTVQFIFSPPAGVH